MKNDRDITIQYFELIVKLSEFGVSKTAIAKVFDVSTTTIDRHLKIHKELHRLVFWLKNR